MTGKTWLWEVSASSRRPGSSCPNGRRLGLTCFVNTECGAWDPGLGNRDRVLPRILLRKLSSHLSSPCDLDPSFLLSQLMILSMLLLCFWKPLVKLLNLRLQFSSHKIGRLSLIPLAFPKAFVSGLERHFSASENRGLGTWPFWGYRVEGMCSGDLKDLVPMAAVKTRPPPLPLTCRIKVRYEVAA